VITRQVLGHYLRPDLQAFGEDSDQSGHLCGDDVLSSGDSPLGNTRSF